MSEEKELTAADVNNMTKAQLVELIDDNELDVDHKAIKHVTALKKAVLDAVGLEDEAYPVAKNNVAIFTYVGNGADSPRVINFMGKQKFIRGQATEVTDHELLMKLPGVTTFVQGEVDEELLHKIDEEGSAAEKARREEDMIINARYNKKFKSEL